LSAGALALQAIPAHAVEVDEAVLVRDGRIGAAGDELALDDAFLVGWADEVVDGEGQAVGTGVRGGFDV